MLSKQQKNATQVFTRVHVKFNKTIVDTNFSLKSFSQCVFVSAEVYFSWKRKCEEEESEEEEVEKIERQCEKQQKNEPKQVNEYTFFLSSFFFFDIYLPNKYWNCVCREGMKQIKNKCWEKPTFKKHSTASSRKTSRFVDTTAKKRQQQQKQQQERRKRNIMFKQILKDAYKRDYHRSNHHESAVFNKHR